MIFLVYIKLEENSDKFMRKYQKFPRSIMKMLFRSKCKKGKFEVQKIKDLECIVLPEVNEKILKKLGLMANVRCWKNVCISENLRGNEKFIGFAKEHLLNLMDGKWLFMNLLDEVVETIAEIKNEFMANQEISILCNCLDELMAEKIKEISLKFKVCNILTNQTKQFRNLEEEIYQANGVVINVSKNYKKALGKSGIVINFDFAEEDLEKCVFVKNTYMVNVKNILLDKKKFEGKNIVFFGIEMPEKYQEYQENLGGFHESVLYESFIYKRTSYKNIKKELLEDGIKIAYLQDDQHHILKKQNLILPKTLDKITI